MANPTATPPIVSISSSIFFSLLIICSVAQEREKCPSFCRYRFCSNFFRDGMKVQIENRFFNLELPGNGLGPFPCVSRPGGVIRELRNVTGGEARVSRFFENDFVPISKFRQDTVVPRFSADQFGWILDEENNRSTIARIQSIGNQEENLHRLCVQMPITSVLSRNGVRRRKRGKSACVGFQAHVPQLLVQFRWESSDDFDLKLEEPNGFEINRFGENRISPNGGRLTSDVGSDTCQTELLREQIVYRRDGIVEEGTYTIRIDHFRKCERSTKYSLGVMHLGRVILSETGTLSTEIGPNVLVSSFTI